MDPILFVRTSFLLGASSGIFLDTFPALRTRFLAYGARSTPVKTSPSPNSASNSPRSPRNLIQTLISLQVPHHWFTHYYILSVLLSLFWGYQLLTYGSALRFLVSYSSQDASHSMSLQRIWLAWGLLAIQGGRRLYESLAFLKRGDAKMSVVVYLVGIGFYLLDGVGVWIEGAGTLREAIASADAGSSLSVSWGYWALWIRAALRPSLRIMLCLPVFIMASGMQHDVHRYLASLKKHTLPAHPLFASVTCPHYLMECVIYLALAGVAAPKGELVNKTIFTTFVFTTVNLGIVAKGTKIWSVEKFGEEARERWRMVPYLW